MAKRKTPTETEKLKEIEEFKKLRKELYGE